MIRTNKCTLVCLSNKVSYIRKFAVVTIPFSRGDEQTSKQMCQKIPSTTSDQKIRDMPSLRNEIPKGTKLE